MLAAAVASLSSWMSFADFHRRQSRIGDDLGMQKLEASFGKSNHQPCDKLHLLCPNVFMHISQCAFVARRTEFFSHCALRRNQQHIEVVRNSRRKKYLNVARG
jgi:hypothetical protein